MHKPIINAKDLTSLLGKEGMVIIDCRFYLKNTEAGHNEYLEGHIPGARYAHLDDDLSGEIIPGVTGRHPFPDMKDFAKKCGNWGIDEHTEVIVYDNWHGGIAARLWMLLKWLGHEKVAVLNGGWRYWIEIDFPVSTVVPAVRGKTYTPSPDQNLLISADKIELLLDDETFQLVDSRSARRYLGEEEPIDPVAGHIPGAINAPFLGNLGEDGLFMEAQALQKRFDELLGGHPLDQSIFYCGSGVTACHNLLALAIIGKEGAKLYPGSWSDWITNDERPFAPGNE